MEEKASEFNIHKFIRKYGMAIISIVLILIVSIVLGIGFKKEDGKEMMMAEQNENSQVITITSETITRKGNELQQDQYPEINELMEHYFKAKLTLDMDTLKQIINPIEGITEEQLDYEINGIAGVDDFRKIEDFQNIICYTKPGLLTGTYVVWVYYEIKFANADTPAPSLNKMYVCTDDTGVYIYNGAIEGEISNYLDEVSMEADVEELVNQVNEKLNQAVEQDADLREIFEQLGSNVEETQASEEVTSGEEE